MTTLLSSSSRRLSMLRGLALCGAALGAFACGSASKSGADGTPEASGGQTPGGGGSRTPDTGDVPQSSLPEPEDGPSPSALVPRYYVSPRGIDSNVCSQREPCREIVRALSLVTAAGGSILAAEGDYAPFSIDGFKGSRGAPLIIRGNGIATIVPASSGDAIRVQRSSWVYFENLKVVGAAGTALAITGGQWITARKCVFGGSTRSNVDALFTDDLRLELNEMYGSTGSNGIKVSASSDRPILRFNIVRSNRYAGIQIDADYERADVDGVYGGTVDGLTTGAVLASNTLYGNGAGGSAAINLDGVKDSLLVNNVLFDNLATGIAAYGDADGIPGDGLGGGEGYDGEGRTGPSGLRILHNTVVMPSASKRAALNLRYSEGATKNVLVNNVLVHENANAPAVELGFASDVALLDARSNAGSSLSGPPSAASGSGGGIRQDAGATGTLPTFSSTAGLAFVDRAKGDLRPRATSTAVNVGGVLADVTQDADGNARPQGAGADLGAYELSE